MFQFLAGAGLVVLRIVAPRAAGGLAARAAAPMIPLVARTGRVELSVAVQEAKLTTSQLGQSAFTTAQQAAATRSGLMVVESGPGQFTMLRGEVAIARVEVDAFKNTVTLRQSVHATYAEFNELVLAFNSRFAGVYKSTVESLKHVRPFHAWW